VQIANVHFQNVRMVEHLLALLALDRFVNGQMVLQNVLFDARKLVGFVVAEMTPKLAERDASIFRWLLQPRHWFLQWRQFLLIEMQLQFVASHAKFTVAYLPAQLTLEAVFHVLALHVQSDKSLLGHDMAAKAALELGEIDNFWFGDIFVCSGFVGGKWFCFALVHVMSTRGLEVGGSLESVFHRDVVYREAGRY
jgi:hypothetical protein